MSDVPQKSNRGGKRVGAGRKPKLPTAEIKGIIEGVVDFEKMIRHLDKELYKPKTSLANKLKIGDLLLAYAHGKPTTSAIVEASVTTDSVQDMTDMWNLLAEDIDNPEDIE
tara:strand:+ start:5481 stop:5813 length:333 start_codon:yes stop_codon:yes gene_type:complete